MIRFFHRYQNSVIVIILIIILCISMAMFGISLPGANASRAAIKVNDAEFDYQDIAVRQRELENQLRRQFGDQYQQILAMMGSNLQERVIDQIIEEELVHQTMAEQGVTADAGAVRTVIQGIFGEDYSPSAYQNYLRQVGLSASQFEARIAQDTARSEFFSVLQDFSKVSEYEARQKAELSGSSYDVSFVLLKPEDVLSEIETPTAEEVLAYYEENATRYETTEQVQYAAVQITPESVLDSVEVFDEDVELYFAENQSDFKKSERAQTAHIQINYGQESDPEALLAVKERAQRIHERAVAGEDFAALALEASDDITTKASGGALGWLSKGSRDDDIEKQALALGVEGITDLIETDYGFHIVKVEAFEAASVPELPEVREEIENRLRRRDAPAYALVKAEELHERWQEGELSLAELAEEEGLTVLKTEKPLSEEEDITSELGGLTRKVLLDPTQVKQFVEFGEGGVLAEILDYFPVEIPGFEAVQEKVKKDIEEERSDALAKLKVQELLAALQSEKVESFSKAAEAAGLSVEVKEGVTRTTANTAPLTNGDVRQALFVTRKPRLLTEEPVLANGAYAAVAVTKVVVPEEFDRPLAEYEEQASKESAGSLQVALIQSARKQAEVAIAPGLMEQ